MFKLDVREWEGAGAVSAIDLECGHCGKEVSSNLGYTHKQDRDKAIVLCPGCGGPTFFVSLHSGRRVPESMPGRTVNGVPKDIASAYNEARRASAAGCTTAATLLCRSILIHIARDKKHRGEQTTVAAIAYLIDDGHVAKKDQERVARLRSLAADSSHDVRAVSRAESLKVLATIEHLLLEVYE